MSKDLEQEYKQLMKQEVPDLWNRIEAALEEKPSAAAPVKDNEDNTGIRKKHFSKPKILRYAGLAAAIFALLFIIPMALRDNFGGSKSTESMDMAESSQMTTEETASTPSEETMTEDFYEDGAAGDEEPDINKEKEESEAFSYRITGKVMEAISGSDGGMQYEIHVTDTGETPLPAHNEIITVWQEESEALLEKGKYYTIMIQDPDPWQSNYHPFILVEILE